MVLRLNTLSAACLAATAAIVADFDDQAYAQSEVQLPFVQAKPESLCFPEGKAPDIVGLPIGMKADDVSAILEQRGFHQFETKEFRLDGPLADLTDSDVKSSPYEFYRHFSLNSDTKREEIELWIAPPISGSVVYQITRTLEFMGTESSPRTYKVDSGLAQKYGDWNEGGKDMCWTYSHGERLSKPTCYGYQDWASMLGNEVDAQLTLTRNTANDKTSQIKTIEYCALTERVLRNDWKAMLRDQHPSTPAPTPRSSDGLMIEL